MARIPCGAPRLPGHTRGPAARALPLLAGHSQMDSTVRNPGNELEDAPAIAEAMAIQSIRPPSSTARSGYWCSMQRTAASRPW